MISQVCLGTIPLFLLFDDLLGFLITQSGALCATIHRSGIQREKKRFSRRCKGNIDRIHREVSLVLLRALAAIFLRAQSICVRPLLYQIFPFLRAFGILFI